MTYIRYDSPHYDLGTSWERAPRGSGGYMVDSRTHSILYYPINCVFGGTNSQHCDGEPHVFHMDAVVFAPAADGCTEHRT